ncbi:hypothetical protein ABZ923_38710 [Streptomyces sp. NPDC046881]|uniref:hypothetical protein n=1 Tax=Streptomyces sp. NPDC046881 TaxID=3155374 RepID=UPI0033DC4DC1
MQHLDSPVLVPHWEGYELARDDAHSFVWIYMGYNIRLIAVPHGPDGAFGYDYAWCYPKDPELVRRAVAQWNGDTQDEPTGWHKRPTREIRRAPHREEAADYNRPRCVHGCYLHEGCRTVNCPDVLDYQNRARDTEPEGTA